MRSSGARSGVPSLPDRLYTGLFSAGILAVVAGLILVLTAPSPAGFGWFAYAPLSDVSFFPEGMLLTPQAIAGAVIGVAGLLFLAFCVGLLIGSRRRS